VRSGFCSNGAAGASKSIRRRGVAAAVSPSKAGPQSTVSQTSRIGAQAIERSCSRSVLVAEVDERRLAIPPDGGRSSLSSFTGARGERASEAGSRRQSCENGGGLLSRPGTSGLCVCGAIRERAARDGRVEGALVEGRRPGSRRQSSLTRRRAEAGLAHGAGWLGETREAQAKWVSPEQPRSRKGEPARVSPDDPRRARQRTSEVTSPTRSADDNAAARGAPPEGLPIAAPTRTERCLVHVFARGLGPERSRETMRDAG